MAWTIRSKNIVSRSNGSSYLLKKNWEPFERLELSIPKKLGAVWTAWAIRSKKIVNRLNGLSYPFQKIVSRSNGSSNPFQKSCEPFKLYVSGEQLAICFETVAQAALNGLQFLWNCQN